MTALALCNTVMPQLSDDGHNVKYQVMCLLKSRPLELIDDGPSDDDCVAYLTQHMFRNVQADSPDEEALVQGASLLGFTLAARTHNKVLHCQTAIQHRHVRCCRRLPAGTDLAVAQLIINSTTTLLYRSSACWSMQTNAD